LAVDFDLGATFALLLTLPVARDVLSARRTALKGLFDGTSEAADRVVQLPRAPLDLTSVLARPKELKTTLPLLRTSQIDRLLGELLEWENVEEEQSSKESIFILAGPPGIGKSHIAYYTALQLFALGRPVLYVPDAGALVEPIMDLPAGGCASSALETALFDAFVELNADLIPSDVNLIELRRRCIQPGVGWSHFMKWLSEQRAVIIIDEHGHAYNQLSDQDKLGVFPLLSPVHYEAHRGIRAVFAGSNQARFEHKLNGTFTSCLRFVTPFTKDEAEVFLRQRSMVYVHDLGVYERYSNFVAREMVKLGAYATADDYVTKRVMDIGNVLKGVTVDDVPYLVDMLNGLFHLNSMGAGTDRISFLDLGYVYRSCAPGRAPRAYPLCYPAAVAMLALWRSKQPAASKRLLELGADDGMNFEQLVWDVMLTRGFSDNGVSLPCVQLGKSKLTEDSSFKLGGYYVSTVKPEAMCAELSAKRAYAAAKKLNVLYRCPKQAGSIDMCILTSDNRVIGIQVSLSSLTAHSKPDLSLLLDDLNVSQFVFLTTSPEEHCNIVKGGKNIWSGWARILDMLRLVDAHSWIGNQ
jgi:hypothetical protein